MNFFRHALRLTLSLLTLCHPISTLAGVTELSLCQSYILKGEGSIADRIKSALDVFFTHHDTIDARNYRQLEGVLNESVMVLLIREILNDQKALRLVASRSYEHSLGFDKITLLEDWKSHYFEEGLPPGKHGWDLRLHIMGKGKKKAEKPSSMTTIHPVLESLLQGLHIHKWNFASRVIRAQFENQRYTLGPLSTEERVALDKLEAVFAPLNPEEVAELRRRMDLLSLAQMDSVSSATQLAGGMDVILQAVNLPELLKILDMSPAELDRVLRIYLHFSNRIDQHGSKEVYERQGEYVARLLDVHIQKEGELYFFPVDLAHRLMEFPDVEASTFILVSPPFLERSPGQFLPPGADRGKQDEEERTYYNEETLRNRLKAYLRSIEND